MRDLSSTPVSRAIRLIIPRAMSLSICLRTTTLARAGFDLFIHPTEWQGLQRNSSQLSPLKEMPSCGKAVFSSSCSVASLVKLSQTQRSRLLSDLPDGGQGGIACAALRPSQDGSRCSLDSIGRLSSRRFQTRSSASLRKGFSPLPVRMRKQTLSPIYNPLSTI